MKVNAVWSNTGCVNHQASPVAGIVCAPLRVQISMRPCQITKEYDPKIQLVRMNVNVDFRKNVTVSAWPNTEI